MGAVQIPHPGAKQGDGTEGILEEEEKKQLKQAAKKTAVFSFVLPALGSRVSLFGNQKQNFFAFTSTDFVDVPSATVSPALAGNSPYRLEIIFAAKPGESIQLRMFNPANPSFGTAWSFVFTGDPSPNVWWNFQSSPSFGATRENDPWTRGSVLQVRSMSGTSSILGSVILVSEN